MYHLLVRMEHIRNFMEFPTNNAQQSSCFLSCCWDLRWIRKVSWICCAGSDSGIPKGPVTFTILHSKTVWYLDLIISFWFFENSCQIICSLHWNLFLKTTVSTIMSHFQRQQYLPTSNAKTSHLTQNYRTTHESYWVILRFLGLPLASYCVGNLPHPQRQDVTLPKQHDQQIKNT